MTIQEAYTAALRHHQAGRLPEAEQIYREILAVQPGHAEALHLLGVIAYQVGRYDEAVELIRQAIDQQPGGANAHNNLGNALKARGELDEAMAAYRQAIRLKPGNPEAHYNLGNALRDRGDLEGASAAYRQAGALRPDFAEAHCNLGNVLHTRGHPEEALAAYRRALALKPDLAEVYCNLGRVLWEQGQLEEAGVALRQAIALQPTIAEAHSNLGNVLKEQEHLEEALAAYRRALALKPDDAEVHNNLGNVLKDMGQMNEAVAACRRAIELKPDYIAADSNLIYMLHYHPAYDAGGIARELKRWERQHAAPLRAGLEPHGNDRAPERRLRIGYVSADFWTHASIFFLLPLLAHHDPQQVEVFAYALVPRPDEATRRIQRHVDHWRNTRGRSDDEVARQIRADRIDILVDLKLHTAHNQLPVFARKPAPVQVTWLGYPGSTGLRTIDYRLSDPYLDPPGGDESVYSEETIRLPDNFWCYDPLAGGEISVNPLPALKTGGVTFGCLNNFCKINEVGLRLWDRVLRAVPTSRLMLLAPEGSCRQRTLDLLTGEGIEASRITFAARVPRRQYLELYHRIDVGLDSLPYNGHTTSLDSFWMGVPVVTLVGRTAVGRAGWGQLMNLQLPELVARTAEAYVRIAAGLAGDLPRLANLRATLRPRMERSPLMDGLRFTRNVEAAYRVMWRKWCEMAG